MEVERTPIAERQRGVHWFSGRVHEVVDEVVESGMAMLTLSAAEAGETVVDLLRAATRLQGLALTVLAHADAVDVADGTGATSTQAWLAHAANVPHTRARQLVLLADSLESSYPGTADALVGGDLDVDQAAVVVRSCDALADLPKEVRAAVGEEVVAKAEAHLVSEARTFNAKRLAGLGKHVLAVVDPDAADRVLAMQLEDEEAQAARRTFFTIRDDGTGTFSGRFRVPRLHGSMLTKVLHAIASPQRHEAIARTVEQTMPDGTVRNVQRVSSEILGEAFTEYVERFPAKSLNHGGVDATVVVTVELEALQRGIGLAGLDTGGHLTIPQVRRLACQAGIIPAVMGGKSHVLDLGKRRYFTKPQRIALGIRDSTCTVEHCDRPAGWCHAHHDLPHALGGPTTLGNGRLLCPRHHTLVHHPDYRVTHIGNGRIALTRHRT